MRVCDTSVTKIFNQCTVNSINDEEIISRSRRVHEPELLTKRSKECGIDFNTISTYIDSFRFVYFPMGSEDFIPNFILKCIELMLSSL